MEPGLPGWERLRHHSMFRLASSVKARQPIG